MSPFPTIFHFFFRTTLGSHPHFTNDEADTPRGPLPVQSGGGCMGFEPCCLRSHLRPMGSCPSRSVQETRLLRSLNSSHTAGLRWLAGQMFVVESRAVRRQAVCAWTHPHLPSLSLFSGSTAGMRRESGASHHSMLATDELGVYKWHHNDDNDDILCSRDILLHARPYQTLHASPSPLILTAAQEIGPPVFSIWQPKRLRLQEAKSSHSSKRQSRDLNTQSWTPEPPANKQLGLWISPWNGRVSWAP